MCLGTFSRRGAVASATIYPCAECASSRSVFIVWKRSFHTIKTAPADNISASYSCCQKTAVWRRVVFALRSFPRKGLEKYAPFRYNQVIWADFAQIQVDLSKNVAAVCDNSKREGIMEIQLQNLTKKFPNRNRKHPGDVIAVNEFNFTIPDGQLIGLLGPSGCGKSPTIKFRIFSISSRASSFTFTIRSKLLPCS